MPGRAFAVKPSENPLPKRDWRWTRSQSILVAMEVFSWRSGPVGCGRTEDKPFQRSKTSSGGISQSCPDYPGQSPLPVNLSLSKAQTAFLSVQRTTNKRMTIEHAECSIQSTKRALATSAGQHHKTLTRPTTVSYTH